MCRYILDIDVQPCLEGFYECHVLAITKQAEHPKATKESLFEYASPSYWEGKADELKIPSHLMDLSAPLPPCIAHIVKRQIDSNFEEWFFAFKKSPAHEKQVILDGYEDGSYSATLKKRRDERAIKLALHETHITSVDPLPLFDPPSKKLKQTTLTQDFNEFPGMELVMANSNQQVIDLTHNITPPIDGGKPQSTIDLTRNHFKSSLQTPRSHQAVVSPPKAGKMQPVTQPLSAHDPMSRTATEDQKKTM